MMNLRCNRRYSFCLFFLISVAMVASAGDIQVSCEPGLRVYLDDEFVGMSTAKEDGLFMLDVSRGTHTVRVEKDGFLSQSFKIRIRSAPVEVKVAEFIPPPTPRPEVAEGPAADDSAGSVEIGEEEIKQLVGSLVITSAPQNCEVELDGQSQTKTAPELSLGGVAAGKHTISFSKPGYEPISGEVYVREGAEVTVRGNLISGQIETTHMGRGALRVISKPSHCTVVFMGERREKTGLWLNKTLIPAGEYPFRASWRGREVASKITIMNGYRTIVRVSFMPGDKPVEVDFEPLS